ncbi:MAG: hypothetical protein PHD61_08710 [Bacteroidales bacterium]|nr:hypothetical protein [Lentimicrobiaceae bacterium]MDD5695370.1 hypothetical protein [Bacteroidales bacterium]
MKIIPCVVCFFLLIPLLSVAQQQEYDALYLNNGSVLRGKVLESIPGQGVKIEMVGSNILVIPENEIEKIVMRETESQTSSKTSQPSKIEVHPQVHLFGGSDQSWGFTVRTAYAFPFRLSLGAGTGVEWFSAAMLPLFADVSYKILPGKWSPFVYAQAGYALPLEENQNTYFYYYDQNNHGGILAGAGAGIRKDFSNHAAITFSVGYRFQQSRMTAEYNSWYDDNPNHEVKAERTEQFNRIALSLGFMFR